jgi:hypothetical protein
MKRKKTSDAVKILHRRYYEGNPERIAQLKEARKADRTLFAIRVNRKEFLELPMNIRRRALREMSENQVLRDYYDLIDVEEDP